MATAGDFLADNLTSIFDLANLEDIDGPDAMLIPQNREKMFDFLVEVRGLVDVLRTIEKPTLDLLAKDFKELLIERIKIVRDKFQDPEGNPIWQDFRESNLGTILLEIGAAEDDKFYLILDRLFTENILDFISDFFFLAIKAREYDYQIKGREAARVPITFVLGAPRGVNVIIPIETSIEDLTGQSPFFTVDEVTIPAGGLRATTEAINAALVELEVDANGEKNQEFILSQPPVIPSSITVISAGTIWETKKNLFKSRSDDDHYVWRVNENQTVTIRFGDGKNGRIPLGRFEITYRTGGGTLANQLQRGTITEIQTDIKDEVDEVVNNITAFNPEAPSGGRDQETINEAKRNIKVHNRSLERSITLSDFEDNAVTISGILRAFAVDRPLSLREDFDLIVGGDDVQLFVVPESIDILSDDQIAAIQQSFIQEFPPISTAAVIPTLALYELIDFEGVVTFSANANFTLAMFSIRQAIQEFFDYTRTENDGSFTLDWGFRKEKFSRSKVVAVIENFTDLGVLGVELTEPSGDVVIDPIKIPRLGNLDNLTAIDVEGNVLT